MLINHKPPAAEAVGTHSHLLHPSHGTFLEQLIKLLTFLTAIGLILFYFFTEAPGYSLHHYIQVILDSESSGQRCRGPGEAGGGPSNGARYNTGAQSHSQDPGSGRHPDAGSRKITGQKRSFDGGSDDEDEKKNPPKRTNKKEPSDKTQQRTNPNVFRRPVHCPYFLHDHDKHSKCSEFMFTELPRLLEHLLDRTHFQPVHCEICGMEFRDQKKSVAEGKREEHIHLRTCRKPDIPFQIPGITKEEEVKIQGLRVGRGRRTVAQAIDKWHEIWKILFPSSHCATSPYVTDHPKVYYLKYRKAEAVLDPAFKELVADVLAKKGISQAIHDTLADEVLEVFLDWTRQKQNWQGEKVQGHVTPKNEKNAVKQAPSDIAAPAKSSLDPDFDQAMRNLPTGYAVSSGPMGSELPPSISASMSRSHTQPVYPGASIGVASHPQPPPVQPLQMTHLSQFQGIPPFPPAQASKGAMLNIPEEDLSWRFMLDTPLAPEPNPQLLDNYYYPISQATEPVPEYDQALMQDAPLPASGPYAPVAPLMEASVSGTTVNAYSPTTQFPPGAVNTYSPAAQRNPAAASQYQALSDEWDNWIAHSGTMYPPRPPPGDV